MTCAARGYPADGQPEGRYIYTKRNDYFEERQCHEPPIRIEIIEGVAWDYILRLIKNPDEFEEKLRQAPSDEAGAMQPKQKGLAHVVALLRHTEKEADKNACASVQAKSIIATRLERQGEEVNMRYVVLL
jgi:hypothetical protein